MMIKSKGPLSRAIVVVLVLFLGKSQPASGEPSAQGMSYQGMSYQGMSYQGMSYQGMSYQGMSYQGMSYQGMSYQGMSYQGMSYQGMSYQGMSYQGMSYQGMSYQGMSYQGPDLRGVDRLGKLGPLIAFVGLELPSRTAPLGTSTPHAVVLPRPNVSTQGIQPNPGPAFSEHFRELFVDPGAVHLQAGPTDTSDGSFISVPGLADPTGDPDGTQGLTGSFWNGVVTDGTDTGAITVYVAAVEKDAGTNLSRYPANDDIYLYTIYYLNPATHQWLAACPADESGRPRAMAVPVNPLDRGAASRRKMSFACTASGVAAKCARNWGYKPWNPALAAHYNACLIAARAAYCQDDQSFTREGTLVDLFDISADGDPANSINKTIGLASSPFAKTPMLHEEYQVSVNGLVPGTGFHLSGLQSSRYPDLDPGRSCAAAPYIDRCGLFEPSTCQRADNLASVEYGATIAVNSPRHCTHRENEIGDPMDPRCSACTSRVCATDPSCCGDPGTSVFPYPESLVWDQRCVNLAAELCRSAPGEAAIWPPSVVAVGAVGTPAKLLRGATGAFEGIVTEGGVQYAEGWACDPDFPHTSSPIEISIGGELGAPGASLQTVVADQPLIRSWRGMVAAECGGGERHGFRVALPAEAAGQPVFVYGIDLNVPGAPFSLLRGGRIVAPAQGAPPLPSPRAAIFTGWVEPAVSGSYQFDVDAGGADKYRLWVNGLYLAGNWNDAVTTPPTPGAFTIAPPSPPLTPFLQKGIRYAVRVEYLRPDTVSPSSHLALTWSAPTASPPLPPQQIPDTALYPIAQSSGNGLQGTYYPGIVSLAALPPPDNPNALPRTFAAVDHVWNDGNPPIPGVTVGDSFGARFDGQLVAPISGEYDFSLDSDGPAQVFVNGQRVVTVGERAQALEGQCAHDICATGAAVSSSCAQNNFCAAFVCEADPVCCSQSGGTWDARCVEEVKTHCAEDVCTPSRPVRIALTAGWKYDIRVDYQHPGSTPEETVRGARLKLMWSLAGQPRAVIPADRLFAATNAPATQLGTGVNAAYFTDADFREEYFDCVEPDLAFQAASPPTAARATSMICGSVGLPACPAPPALDPPALTRAVMGAPLRDAMMSVTLEGAARVPVVGGVPDPSANLFLRERTPTGALVDIGAVAFATATGGGKFTTRPFALARRRHVLLATLTVGAEASALSEELVVDVNDPGAPPPPVGQAIRSDTGPTVASGTAAPGATVKVVVRVEGQTTSVQTFEVTADSTGRWSLSITLPPGSYDVTFTQASGGHTSNEGATFKVQVLVPALTIIEPAEGLSLTCPTETCPVNVSGSAASDRLGPIIVADGDDSFVDLPTVPESIGVNADGTFAGQVALDRGRHKLKIFQRANGLAGAAVPPRTVLVRPPVAPLVVTSPANNDVINPSVTVSGSGPPRQGLRGRVVVYQVPRGVDACPASAGPAGAGAIKLGEATMDDADGRFMLPAKVSGFGRQCLAVSYTAGSLSGAGEAESELSPVITVLVRPRPPRITRPRVTGTLQPDDLRVAVEGRADPGAIVEIFAERPSAPALTWSTPAANGTFAATLPLPAPGTYRLTATATLDGAGSARSEPPVAITVGDVIPPTLKVADPADAARRPVREIPLTAANDGGVDFDFGPWVTAIDPSPSGGGVPLDPSRLACQPAAGSPFHFPLGATPVTCTTTDAAGNSGSTTFLVVVRSTEAPVLNGSGLTAEAQSPAGAVVNYQIAASGFIADCAPPGSGTPQDCPAWRSSSNGLGMNPTALAMDDATGHFYVGVLGSDGAQLLKSTDAGMTWQALTAPGVKRISSIVVASGTLYVLPSIGGRSLKISRDGGQSWLTSLQDFAMRGVAHDPRDAAHLLAWNDVGPGADAHAALFETRDGGVTWVPANDGLPDVEIGGVAIDPINADRMYLSLTVREQFVGGLRLVRLFRRTAGGVWRERPVFPFDSVFNNKSREVFVAPWTGPCPTGQPFPAVFAGPLYSCDGGESWQETEALASLRIGFGFGQMAFDRNVPGRIYAATLTLDLVNRLYTSADYGRTWTIVPSLDPLMGMSTGSLVQDPGGRSLYAADLARGFMHSEDGGRIWNAVSSDQPLGELSVPDLAGDPIDPAIAYVALETSGVFSTANGGATWAPRNGLLHVGDPAFRADKVVVHPLARNLLFTGSAGVNLIGPATQFSWAASADSGATWPRLFDIDRFPLTAVELTADPLAADGWLAAASMFESYGNGTLRWPSGLAFLPLDFGELMFNLQMVPDAARTVVASTADFSNGRTLLVSFREMLEGASFPSFVDIGLSGPANVVYDGSDGTHRLFVGGTALGRDPNVLYRAKVNDLLAGLLPDGWEPLVGDGVLPAFQIAHAGLPTRQDSFATLLIDPVGGGQTMYTLGSGNTLWESRDGGRSWRRDDAAPGFATAAWLSPVDGALYATISPRFADTEERFWSGALEIPVGAPGRLWKRARSAGVLPGGRVVRGDLRVTCAGPPGFPGAITPGSTFPVGDTILSCAATDVFGNPTTASFTVSVRDTAPPVLTLPAPIAVTAGPGNTAVVAFTATASDAVNGARPVACSPASGTAFSTGTTTVSCSASDAAGNLATGSFTVTVDNTPPTVTVPANITREATSPSGAVVTFTATATDPQDGARPVSCTPASGSTFPIATTTVSCSATDTGGATTTATFTVNVQDTTAPVLTVPADVTFTSGFCTSPQHIGTATASDAVSPPVTLTNNRPNIFKAGTTTVTYTARDARGNTTTRTQRVTVVLGDDSSCCPTGSNIIIGTPGPDTINTTTPHRRRATSGSDCILGRGGDDDINGGGGNDYISGGGGDDDINGGSGTDACWGGAGRDAIASCP